MEKKYQRFKYSNEALQNAIAEVKSGKISLNKASAKYLISKATLHNKITCKVPNVRKMGPLPVLTSSEEERIERWILAKAKLGFPMHPDEVKDSVQKILKTVARPNKFTDDRPGDKWIKLFLRRHPSIGKRNTEIISKSRAAVTEEALRQWFFELQEYLQNENVLDMMTDPTRIYNADETGMRTCTKSGMVLGPKTNFKNLYEVSSGSEKESITVLCNYNAAGAAAPPMIVFGYKRIPKELALSVPTGWAIGRSDSGWMTSATFFEYVANVFYPWLLDKCVRFPVILFIDGHKSHYNLELYEFCVAQNIILYCLYPNATHIIQPCDVGIFGPLKVQWKKICRAHKQNTDTMITRHNFSTLFKEAFDKACKSRTISNAFAACGLYPLNPNAVDYNKFITSRRHELFPSLPTTGLTNEDYNSSLKVLETFLGKVKIEEYSRRDAYSGADDEMYCYWKYCKQLQTEQATTSPVETKIPSPLQNCIDQKDPVDVVLTDSFLNDLPLEIDEILYAHIPNDTVETTDITKPGSHENMSHQPSQQLENIQEHYGQFAVELEMNTADQPRNSLHNISYGESKLVCENIMDLIIENVFHIVKSKNKINIMSNIVIGKAQGDKLNALWEKHLHWPQQEIKLGTKRKTAKKRKLQRELKKMQTHKNLKPKPVRRVNSRKDKTVTADEEERDASRGNTEKMARRRQRTSSREENTVKNEADREEDKRLTNTSNKQRKRKLSSTVTSSDITINDYVIVKYQCVKYPGVVKDTGDDEYEVSVMEKQERTIGGGLALQIKYGTKTSIF